MWKPPAVDPCMSSGPRPEEPSSGEIMSPSVQTICISGSAEQEQGAGRLRLKSVTDVLMRHLRILNTARSAGRNFRKIDAIHKGINP